MGKKRIITGHLGAMILLYALRAHADYIDTTVMIGGWPGMIAVDTTTDNIYVVNGSVSVINGATNTSTAVSVGQNPGAIAVNQVTHTIYVANQGSGGVSVIDGATNKVVAVTTGASPSAIAINQVTDKIYVANRDSSSVTVIDGAADSTATVHTGSSPVAIDVDPITNKIYVADFSNTNVTVIDGATNATAAVPVGANPSAIAVNAVTDKIYVSTSTSITVIDGATNTTSFIQAPPGVLAVNPSTNKIYVADTNVSVIDGATGAVTKVLTGAVPGAIAIDTKTDKIYVACFQGGNVTIIDGATNAATDLNVGLILGGIAVNPATDLIYASNSGNDGVTVINGAAISGITLVAPSDNAAQVSLTPTFRWNSVSYANAYAVQVSPFWPPWNNTIINTRVSTDSLSGVSLNPGTRYYWAVAGTNGGMSGPLGIDSFTTLGGTPATPVLISPPNGSSAVPRNPRLLWDSAVNATTYEVQVASNGLFASTVLDTTVSGTTLPLVPLAANTAYFWRVRGYDNPYATGNWSGSFEFATSRIGVLNGPPRINVPGIGYAGVLAVYSLNGRQIIRTSFTASSTKERLLRVITAVAARGCYRYRFFKDRKVMNEGNFVVQ